MSIRDIEIVQQERDNDLLPQESIPAVIMAVNGSVSVSGRAGYIWVSEFNQPESLIQAFNLSSGVQPIAGNLVELGKPNQTGLRQVLRIYDGISGIVSDDDDLGALSVPPHRTAHQYPTEATKGADAVLLYQPGLQLLKCTGDGATLVVSVSGLPSYRYNDTRKAFGGNTYDLTASVPGVASTVRVTLLYLNAQTNSLAIVDGTAVPDTGAVPIPEPALPEAGMASCYVRLANGQSTITTTTDITDARTFLEPRVSDTLQEATAAGQILISHDGIVFEAGVPVVDANGAIVTDVNGYIVVV